MTKRAGSRSGAETNRFRSATPDLGATYAPIKNIITVRVYVTHLLDLLDTLELDEEDNGEDLVVMQALHGAQMDVQNAMLALQKHKKRHLKHEEKY